jgi:hypothetical protein
VLCPVLSAWQAKKGPKKQSSPGWLDQISPVYGMLAHKKRKIMAQPFKNNVVSMRNPQEQSTKKAYDRMPGERALWFQRFKRYCQMGRERSIQAVWEQERQAQTSTKNENVDAASLVGADERVEIVKTTPGNWTKTAAQWQWRERAEAYDVEQHQVWEERVSKEVLLDTQFTSRGYRIFILDTYACFLRDVTTKTFEDKNVTMRDKLAAIKLTQSLMKDIRREMNELEKLS